MLVPRVLAVVCVVAGCSWGGPPLAFAQSPPPNMVVVLADDMGYADASVSGAKGYATPRIDRMAAEGVRFTDFYVAEPVCSASRAALLTGRYSKRVGVTGALMPGAAGLPAGELTLAEILKERGYATGMFGKWHLGDLPTSLPTHHGFDEFAGLPYSNDMWPRHPNPMFQFPPLRWIQGDRPVNDVGEAEQAMLTESITQRAEAFIEKHKARPFFLYVAHPMPHVPLYVSPPFRGRTGAGLYADVMAELDASLGRILEALARHGLDERTIVIFTSDNGPWLMYGNHAGSAAPFRLGKHTTFEGGVRVPFIVRWPGQLPRGAVVGVPAMAIDVLPTLAARAGAAVPTDRAIDGRDLWPWLKDASHPGEPHEALFFYGGMTGTELHAVRAGAWKLHVPHPWLDVVPGSDGAAGRYVAQALALSLYDLSIDPGESSSVAGTNHAVVEALMRHVERARDDLGDSLTGRAGKNVRAPRE